MTRHAILPLPGQGWQESSSNKYKTCKEDTAGRETFPCRCFLPCFDSTLHRTGAALSRGDFPDKCSASEPVEERVSLPGLPVFSTTEKRRPRAKRAFTGPSPYNRSSLDNVGIALRVLPGKRPRRP